MKPVALLVIAKEPLPGRAKTRLTPPCSADEAAALAHASLLDTTRRGRPHAGGPQGARVRRRRLGAGDVEGFELIPQRGAGLGERLAAAFDDVASPALLVGMDTPQLTPPLLLEGMRALATPDVDAVLGPTLDGGYWSVGFSTPRLGRVHRRTDELRVDLDPAARAAGSARAARPRAAAAARRRHDRGRARGRVRGSAHAIRTRSSAMR